MIVQLDDPGHAKLRANLRVTVPRFAKELLRDEGVAVGRLDSRYVADEADDTADSSRLGDAASNAISSAFTAASSASPTCSKTFAGATI